MAANPLLGQISRLEDPLLVQILTVMAQKLSQLQGGDDLNSRVLGDLDMEEGRVKNVAAPVDPGDAVPLSYLQANYGPDAIKAALSSSGSAPLNLSALAGTTGQVQPAKLRIIPQGDPFPPVGTAQDSELIRIFTGGAWHVYVFEPSPPPGVWTLVV